jgi:hypothetical protein
LGVGAPVAAFVAGKTLLSVSSFTSVCERERERDTKGLPEGSPNMDGEAKLFALVTFV